MRVVVTRPQREAERWVRDLVGRGFDAVALPLIDIGPASNPEPVHRAWRGLAGCAAAMFVSGNAVEQFFASKPPQVHVDWTSLAINLRAWATGPGTRNALLSAGVPSGCIDAPNAAAGQFDSEALWAVVGEAVRPGQRVLIVRGGTVAAGQAELAGRDWLARTLATAGVQVDEVLAYERRAPVWSPVQRALAQQAAGDGSVWLLSSSEAVANLATVLPGQGWQGARCVATHPRIAQAARDAGFGTVLEARPTLDDVVASIESGR
jgi:uroporphyrinogen-III synthase